MFIPTLAGMGALATQQMAHAAPRPGRLKQCVTRGCFGRGSKMTFDDMCMNAAKMGVVGFDLIGPQDFPVLKKHGLRQSMSGKGNCYDNAQAESFWARFKTELVEDGAFRSVDEARSETFSYIEGYYNPIRRHSSLGYLSPIEFERKLENSKNEAACKSNRKDLSVRVVSSFT